VALPGGLDVVFGDAEGRTIGQSASENGLSAPLGGTSGWSSNGSHRMRTPSFLAASSIQTEPR
jgi:hypothetical protein